MDIPNKKKYSGNRYERDIGHLYRHTKQFPRQHAGNSTKKVKKNPSGDKVESVNNTYLAVDGKTGRSRMKRR